MVSMLISSRKILNIDNNNKCFLRSKSAYSMLSEGSCDTDDCLSSNDAEIQICSQQYINFKAIYLLK